jgi:uncharacterized membrane protein
MREIALSLHVLGVVIWVGGMFFAHMALRPVALRLLEPAQRLPLWAGVFGRFFPWVWASVSLILGSGLYLLLAMGGFRTVGWPVHLMFALGLAMTAIFLYIFFSPYRRLKQFVALRDWKGAADALARIRKAVGINLSLGILVILAATAGGLVV